MPVDPATLPLPFLEPAWPDVRRESWGRVSVDIADHGFRNLAVDGVVLVTDLYAVVRAPNWATVGVDAMSVDVQERDGSWHITCSQAAPGRFRSTTELEVRPDTSLAVDHELVLLADQLVNRWGLSLCLDAVAWAGAEVTVAGESHSLPANIAPQRLVDGEIHALYAPAETVQLVRPHGERLRIASAGLPLELEDQRNWTDPTYKVYSGSLQDPRPFLLERGRTYRQTLELTPEVSEGGADRWGSDRVAEVVGPIRELRIGVQVNQPPSWGMASVTADLAGILKDLGVDHVRVDAERPWAGTVLDMLPPVEVELAVLGSGGQDAVGLVSKLAARASGPVRVIWHRDHRRTTSAADAKATGLATKEGRVTVVPGTDAYFVDLNRDRPDVGPAVSLSMVPTVHTTDSQTVFASLATQAEVVRQTRRLFLAEVDVSPITWTTRGDPEDQHDAAHRVAGSLPNPGALTLERAAWTLGSVHALMEGGAHSGTWHELFGDAGLVGDDDRGERISPAFHALVALAVARDASTRLRARAVNAAGAPWVGIQFLDSARLVVASLRPWPQVLDFRSATVSGLTRQRLTEQDVSMAVRTRRWWETAARTNVADPSAVTLEPFEISVVHGTS